MSQSPKALHRYDDDQNAKLHQHQIIHQGNSQRNNTDQENKKKLDGYQGNLLIIALVLFLVIVVGIFTYRYMIFIERTEKMAMQITEGLQNRDHTTALNELNKENSQINSMKGNDKEITGQTLKQGFQEKNSAPLSDPIPYRAQQVLKQPQVYPQSLLQNSMQLQHPQLNPNIDLQSSKLPDQVEDDSADDEELEDLGEDETSLQRQQADAKAEEELEMVDIKESEKMKQLNDKVVYETQLHPKLHITPLIQSHQGQESPKNPEQQFQVPPPRPDFAPEFNLPDQHENKVKNPNFPISDSNVQTRKNTPNLNPKPKPQTINPAPTVPIGTVLDESDPIIRVKNKVQERFNEKFEDLIYIKPGTKITEDQYYSARERMNIWKYYNPKTGNIEFLDEVNYQGQILDTTQAEPSSLEKIQKIILQQKLEYEQKYQVSQYNEIPFCIIIPSYKNQDKYFRNLNSIFAQQYSNYHVIYIDDASHDGTAEKVREYIEKYSISEERMKFIQNSVNKKALPNIDYAARRMCNSGEIMTIIDGDDYLIGTQVFKMINARYQKEHLLALYTNHLRIHEPIYLKVGTCLDYPERVKKTRSYRRYSIFPASHLRTFFVDLYWRINVRDLKDYKGEYFTAANDFAIMMPILEMAGDRMQYMPELTYVYDAGTGFNNFQTKADTQANNFKITKRRHKYPKIVHELEFEKNLVARGLLKPKQIASYTPPQPQVPQNKRYQIQPQKVQQGVQRQIPQSAQRPIQQTNEQIVPQAFQIHAKKQAQSQNMQSEQPSPQIQSQKI